jgi:hypothetical protein
MDVQAILTMSVPTLAVLVGVLINNSRISAFRAHMDRRFDDLPASMDAPDLEHD